MGYVPQLARCIFDTHTERFVVWQFRSSSAGPFCSGAQTVNTPPTLTRRIFGLLLFQVRGRLCRATFCLCQKTILCNLFDVFSLPNCGLTVLMMMIVIIFIRAEEWYLRRSATFCHHLACRVLIKTLLAFLLARRIE